MKKVKNNAKSYSVTLNVFYTLTLCILSHVATALRLSDLRKRQSHSVTFQKTCVSLNYLASITSRCSGKEPALLPELTAGLVDLALLISTNKKSACLNLRRGFRATLNFRKFKVALNPLCIIFLNFAKSCVLSC